MRLLVCGDRNWTNRELIREKILDLKKSLDEYSESLVIIEGEANGADLMARSVAEELGLQFVPFPADWNRFHKAAGPIRNSQMLIEGQPHQVFAFHNDLAHSRGTKDMVTKAQKVGLPVEIYTE